jgi:hypothetical protein
MEEHLRANRHWRGSIHPFEAAQRDFLHCRRGSGSSDGGPAVTKMNMGASQIKAGMTGGDDILKEAIEALDSNELRTLVSPENTKRIKEFKKLLS